MKPIWHAQIVYGDQSLKPRQPTPHIEAGDFQRRLQPRGAVWVLTGAANEWAGLQDLELLSITVKQDGSVERTWDTACATEPPMLPDERDGSSVRATLALPVWGAKGWSAESPGFVFWSAMRPAAPLNAAQAEAEAEEKARTDEEELEAILKELTDTQEQALALQRRTSWSTCWLLQYGVHLVRELEAAEHCREFVTKAHLVAFRYVHTQSDYSFQDSLLYHTAIVLEWSHAEFCTVVELGFVNGLSGYDGRSNWVDCVSSFNKAIPDEMRAPWVYDKAEIRLTDHPAPDIHALLKWVAPWNAKDEESSTQEHRFIAFEIAGSCDVRVSHCAPQHIAQYLLNYNRRHGGYDQKSANCQTFAADFFGFLAGKGPGVDVPQSNSGLQYFQPYSLICRPMYKPRPYLFLYEH